MFESQPSPEKYQELAFEQAKQESAFALPQPELNQELELENIPTIFKNSLFVEHLESQEKNGSRTVVITDVDRTFWLKDQPELSQKLSSVLEKTGIPLIYCSGRDIGGLEGNLPNGDAVMAAVGTELYVRQQDGALKKDGSFAEFLQSEGWRAEAVHQIISNFIADKPELQWQPGYEISDPNQRPEKARQEFKISLFFSPSDNLSIEKVSEELNKLLPSGAGVVISTNYHLENSYFIDFLPKVDHTVGKALAILYLKKFFPIHTIVAGDSGNDLSMMLESDSDAILVGNALPEALEKVRTIPSIKERERIKFYKGDNRDHAIYIGDPREDGPKAIASALGRGDFNPQIAPFVKTLSIEAGLIV